MATYKLNLQNPLTTKTVFNIKVKGLIQKVTLSPQETIDLTTLDTGFTIKADSPTDPLAGQKVSTEFMSGRGNLEILMRDFVRGYDKVVKVRNRPFADYFFLTA